MEAQGRKRSHERGPHAQAGSARTDRHDLLSQPAMRREVLESAARIARDRLSQEPRRGEADIAVAGCGPRRAGRRGTGEADRVCDRRALPRMGRDSAGRSPAGGGNRTPRAQGDSPEAAARGPATEGALIEPLARAPSLRKSSVVEHRGPWKSR